MSASFELEGVADLIEALRALPAALTAEANAIVRRHADAAAAAIRAGYREHWFTGNLAEHVSVREVAAGEFGAASEVRATARHVHIFERGTEARHYVTRHGRRKLVGRMPAHPVFIPAMRRQRLVMWQDFAALLRENGLEVTDDGR